jgi:dienelactone hydrolase
LNRSALNKKPLNKSVIFRGCIGGCIAAGLAVSIAACDVPPAATSTPTDEPITIIAPSKTVAPLAPTMGNTEISNVDVGNFTPGAAPVSADNTLSTLTPTPAPTDATIPMTFIMPDGLTIAGTYYGAANRPAPTVLLLHMLGANKESWGKFAPQLQQAGFNVLAIDLRGHGDSGGQPDWDKAPDDIKTVLSQLGSLSGVNQARISIMGASVGANLALKACADTQLCKSLVLISPALDYVGIQTKDPMAVYGNHPVLIIASRDDKPSGSDSAVLYKLAKGDHRLQLYDGSVHGTDLLGTQTGLSKLIVDWLTGH